ncbi:MAG: XrtV sorting system accessory protein [Parvularculaceae bacterium]
MITVFDVYSVALLLVSLTVFVIRYIRQDPPIMPYLVIACVCAVGNWMGNYEDTWVRWGAMSLLVAASFLFLTCLLAPYHARLQAKGEAESAKAGEAAAHPAS